VEVMGGGGRGPTTHRRRRERSPAGHGRSSLFSPSLPWLDLGASNQAWIRQFLCCAGSRRAELDGPVVVSWCQRYPLL
jgi:hypothetical protein